LNRKGWWEVLQLADECYGLVSATVHACGCVIVTDSGTNSNDPGNGVLDIKDSGCLFSGRVRWGRGGAVDCAFKGVVYGSPPSTNLWRGGSSPIAVPHCTNQAPEIVHRKLYVFAADFKLFTLLCSQNASLRMRLCGHVLNSQ
jgi:hypothetical protein